MALPEARSRVPVFEVVLPWAVLGVLVWYSVGLFFILPYAGFEFRGLGSGVVSYVFAAKNEANGLRPGDQLVQVGATRWADYRANLFPPMLGNVQPGQIVPIVVERAGQRLTIPWRIAGRTSAEFLYRLENEWVIAFVFWAGGTATLLFLRPRNRRRTLLVAFNYLLALWLAGGSTMARWHYWYAAPLQVIEIWLAAAVLVHLHWVFPEPLGRVPRYAAWIGYGVVAALAVAEVTGLIPLRTYLYGFLIASLVALLTLVGRFLLLPHQRRALALIGFGAVIAVLPNLVAQAARQAGALTQSSAAIIAFPALPGAYLYAAAQRQLGGLELRANRVIAGYLFFVLVGTVLLGVIPWAASEMQLLGDHTLVALATSLTALMLGAFGFAPFQRWVETRLLGVRVTDRDRLRALTLQITSRLDMPGLLHLLRETVLPSLFVRQAALLRLDDAGQIVLLDTVDVSPEQLPTNADIPALLAEDGKYRPPGVAQAVACPWVRLALTLRYDDKPVGLWLLGRLDPDDFYGQAEIANLQMLADQMALAIMHISQAGRLRVLYENDADRFEMEHSRLARDLHDVVMNGLVALRMTAEKFASPLHDNIQALIGQLKVTLGNLRQTYLNYGLMTALDNLADNLQERAPEGLTVFMEVPPAEATYPPEVELHIFRIVEQAAENALRHAKPTAVRLHGRLEQDHIDLTVADDGQGFAATGPHDLERLLALGHFGLAGMVERAALIHAQVTFDSEKQSGTRIRVVWRPKPVQP